MVGPEIHDFSLDDQLTVDFVHPMSWLKWIGSGQKFLAIYASFTSLVLIDGYIAQKKIFKN